jgi:hypothetical protein
MLKRYNFIEKFKIYYQSNKMIFKILNYLGLFIWLYLIIQHLQVYKTECNVTECGYALYDRIKDITSIRDHMKMLEFGYHSPYAPFSKYDVSYIDNSGILKHGEFVIPIKQIRYVSHECREYEINTNFTCYVNNEHISNINYSKDYIIFFLLMSIFHLTLILKMM